MMDSLIDIGLTAAFRQAHTGQRRVQRHVDFVKGQPQLDLLPVAPENRDGVVSEKTNQSAVSPAVIAGHQIPGHLVVGERHHRRNSVLQKLVKQPVVVGQTGFIRGLLITLWIDSCPGDGNPQAGKPHLAEEFNVLRVAVVKVDGHVLDAADVPVTLHHLAEDACGLNVRGGHSFTVLVPCALNLVCGNCSAPVKIIREFFHESSSLNRCHQYRVIRNSLFICQMYCPEFITVID